jgi:hypothetical protein
MAGRKLSFRNYSAASLERQSGAIMCFIKESRPDRSDMPLYYFHVREGSAGLLSDPEGSHLPDLAAARKEAVEGARQLISTAVLTGEPLGLGREMQVDDENGTTLLTLRFRDVIDQGDN